MNNFSKFKSTVRYSIKDSASNILTDENEIFSRWREYFEDQKQTDVQIFEPPVIEKMNDVIEKMTTFFKNMTIKSQ